MLAQGLTWLSHVGSHVGSGLRWRVRWQGHVGTGRRQLGRGLAGVWGHGGGCGWCQKKEDATGMLMLTGVARMRGGKITDDEVKRRRGSVKWRHSVPMELRRNGGEHRVRGGVAKPVVVVARTRRRWRRR